VVKGEYYEDHDTGADGDYEYQVSSLLNERIESAPSAVTGIKIQDTFPPDIPANLVAFTAKDHVFLTWEAVRDRDLGHYNVYRRSAKDEDFKLLDAAVTDNFYRDRQVVKGQLYIYTIVAVDKKGNESEPSHAVRQFFE
jgi:fibronectin type 3 domain-containing protein